MKKVYMEKADDSLQACVASVLELELKEVPEFAGKEDWHCRLEIFLRKYGLFPVLLREYQAGEIIYIVYGSVIGGYHYSVFEGSEVIHDPHPIWVRSVSLVYSIVFVACDPAKMATNYVAKEAGNR